MNEHKESLFDIFMQNKVELCSKSDLMEIKEIKNHHFVELAFHLHQLSNQLHLLHPLTEEQEELHERRYINQLKTLKLHDMYDLFQTMAYFNFNSSLALDQLIWIVGETKQLHESFFDIQQTREGTYKQVSIICENVFVKEELKMKLVKIPYSPYVYHCRFKPNIDELYLEECVRFGNLRLIKWIVQTYNIIPRENAITWACGYGHLEVVQYLCETFVENQFRIRGYEADWACQKGYSEVVKYIFTITKIKPNNEAANLACQNGHLEMVQCMKETFGYEPNTDDADFACKSGNLELVKYLYIFANVKPTVFGANLACRKGKLELIQYLKESLQIEPTQHGLILALECNNLEIIPYLNANCSEHNT
jgi:hypothetical protein